jgi:hypothetical protein
MLPFQIAREGAGRFRLALVFLPLDLRAIHNSLADFADHETGFLFLVVQGSPLRCRTLVVRPRDSGSAGEPRDFRFRLFRGLRAIY